MIFIIQLSHPGSFLKLFLYEPFSVKNRKKKKYKQRHKIRTITVLLFEHISFPINITENVKIDD